MTLYAHSLKGKLTQPLARPNQFLNDHLLNVAQKSKGITKSFGLENCGELIGFLHDLGKFSQTFQNYIHSAANLISTDDIEYVDATGMKGKIDHSTAGAQWIWKHRPNDEISCLSAQILALSIASHHSGLIDCLSPEGAVKFLKRMRKEDSKTFLEEVEKYISKNESDLLTLFELARKEIDNKCRNIAKCVDGNSLANAFRSGLLSRLILSSLVDADRLDSAGRDDGKPANWPHLIKTFEFSFTKFKSETDLDQARKLISISCKDSAERVKGIYFLTVPTGGGKTLSSLRFALHHAKKHDLERIIYVIPYTSIIEQNAKVVREFLASIDDVVLEHHSNLTPEKDTEKSRLLAENWDSPIVFTTSVQLLECLFSSGTRGVRRMHNLANAVIIFDEPQSLPLKVTHLLNNALNFLHEQCGSTIVLCTATQPLLHEVSKEYGCLNISPADPEIISDKNTYFQSLRRVSVFNICKSGGHSYDEIKNLISKKSQEHDSILFVANTKVVAREVFQRCREATSGIALYHLSTNMCPAHRRTIFEKIKEEIGHKRLICISTQLIEAGVDISFKCVFRSLAGLDSVAQAAGRCNRHSESNNPGQVYIINSKEENLSSLPEIRIAQDKTERILREYEKSPQLFDNDLIGLKAINRYYKLYFYERSHEMLYPINGDTLLNQLSENTNAVHEYQRQSPDHLSPPIFLRQSFESAGKAFEVIEAPTEGIIVPYDETARRIIGELCSTQWNINQTRSLLKQAQRYSVNVFSRDKIKLLDEAALYEAQPDSGIFCLKDPFYNTTFGLNLEGNGHWSFQNV